MNPAGASPEHGDSSWVGENWGDHTGSLRVLESRQYPTSCRLEWDWDNAMFTSQQHHGRRANEDDQGHKTPMTAEAIGPGFRSCNGMNIPTAVPANLSQGMLSSSGLRHFANMDVSSSSFPASSFQGGSCSNYGVSALAARVNHADFSSSFDKRHSLFGIGGIRDQKGQHTNDIVKHEDELYTSDGPANIGLNLGVRTYFSTEDTMAGRLVKRPRVNSPGSQVPRCQAEGCKGDLSTAKHYHRRHKVCEMHSKAASVISGGQTQRFCQQCSRFHPLSEFDDGKRSCRKRLADHNRRRRKPQAVSNSGAVTPAASLGLVKKEDYDETGSNCSGHPPTAISTSDAQALLSAISLSPSVSLMDAKRHLPPLAGSSQEAVYQYLHRVGQTGTHLSLSTLGGGMRLERQNRQNVIQNYNDVDPPLPWFRSAASARSDINDSGLAGPLNLQQIMLNKSSQAGTQGNSSSAQVFSPSIQSMVSNQSPREISNSDWVLSREPSTQFSINMPGNLDGQQALSLLETSASAAKVQGNCGGQRSVVVEFLHSQPRVSSSGRNDSQPGTGHQSDVKYPELQALRPFGASVYDSNQTIL